jgi:hypothetical protein
MMLSKVKKLYPEAKKVFIREVFRRGDGWVDFGVKYPLTLNRLKDLKFFGYTYVNLEILDEDGWYIAKGSDYALSEFGI